MNQVVCIVAVAPLRKEASHRSELVSELLFGEYALVLEHTKDFIKVKCIYDGYEGWCQRSQLAVVDAMLQTSRYVGEAFKQINFNGQHCYIGFASPVYSFTESVLLGGFHVDYSNSDVIDTSNNDFNAASIKSMASVFLNTPYLWGGKSIFGIDCSGFTQQVYKLFQMPLQRDASQQVESGEVVGFLQEAICGDLAFFDNEEGRITHVGILLNSQEIIHASGRVRIDRIDHAGIISTDTGERTHQLRIIKRYKK